MFIQAPLERGSDTPRPKAVYFFLRGLFQLKYTEHLLCVVWELGGRLHTVREFTLPRAVA